MGYTFKDLAIEVLTIIRRPASVAEIWESAVTNNFDAKLKSTGKTPQATLSAALTLEIKNKQDTIFQRTSDRPQRYYLKNVDYAVNNYEAPAELTVRDEECNTTEKENPKNFNERDLHILLSTFVVMSPTFQCVT